MRVLIANTAVLLSLAAPAYAACGQANFAGNWAMYVVIHDTPASWVRCDLRISRDGAIMRTSCPTSDGALASLWDGRITLANTRNCTFTGSFKLNGEEFVIEHMTLAANKLTAVGVGSTRGRNGNLHLMEYTSGAF